MNFQWDFLSSAENLAAIDYRLTSQLLSIGSPLTSFANLLSRIDPP